MLLHPRGQAWASIVWRTLLYTIFASTLVVHAHVLTCDCWGILQVQAENVQQAEALVRMSDKLERLEGDVRDTQGLLGALHGAELALAALRTAISGFRSCGGSIMAR